MFTKEPLTLSDDEAVAAILREPMFVIEDLGRDRHVEASRTAPVDEAAAPDTQAPPSFFKRRKR